MKSVFPLFVLFFSTTVTVLAQDLCQGNLGENIFEAGDFGSGTEVILPVDPSIAPGYIYVTNPPPSDGFYLITNNSGNWSNNYGTWISVGDNSNDPNGYYMCVNASFDPGLFYEQTIEGLCENTLYVFSADVINMIAPGEGGHIAPNISFLLDGVEQLTTGDVPQTQSWITYGFTFETLAGQTSLTLALRNNAPGGIGNDLGLDNITFRACGPRAQILPETVERICEDGQSTTLAATIDGDQYPTPALQWQRSLDDGTTWIDIPGETDLTIEHTELSSGFYYYRYLLANGVSNLQSTKCRVVSNVKIVEVVPKRWNVTDTICDGLTYQTGNSSYTTNGVYVDSLISSLGCDSIVTLDLTVVPDPGLVTDVEAIDPNCPGEAGAIIVRGVSPAAPPFRYELVGIDSTRGVSPNFGNLPPGVYTLGVTDRFGCSVLEDYEIVRPRDFFVELGADRLVTLGDPLTLNVNATDSVSRLTWTPDLFDCDEDCDRITFFPTAGGLFRLAAVSARGCPASDSIRITVIDERRVYIPNAFSPNGDGVNDTFLPLVQQPNVSRIISMRIFDRWGGLIYEQLDPTPNDALTGWDGRRNGDQPAAPGLYAYVIEVEFLDGQSRRYGGGVSLVR